MPRPAANRAGRETDRFLRHLERAARWLVATVTVPKREERLPKISANARLQNGRFLAFLCILRLDHPFSSLKRQIVTSGYRSLRVDFRSTHAEHSMCREKLI